MSVDRPMHASPIRVRLGTRGSRLALWQANWVAERLSAVDSVAVETVIVKTAAERFPQKALKDLGVGVFTQELDAALLRGECDLAVHSLKDLASSLPAELTLAAVPERESAFDAFVSPIGLSLRKVSRGARIGTSSPRRRAQLLRFRPDLEIVPLRGNVETRLRKIETEGLAGTILAHAGLRRLETENAITELLPPHLMVPAVSQGALGIVMRGADRELVELCQRALEHRESRLRVSAERSYLRHLKAGCQTPAGALATILGSGEEMELRTVLASVDGKRTIDGLARGPVGEAEALGEKLAREALEKGAEEILRSGG